MMRRTRPGQKNSAPTDNFDKILDEYESSLGLPKASEFSEIKDYLTMSRHQIEQLSPLQCCEIAFILSQFAFFIQKESNKQTARLNRTKLLIKEKLASVIHQYKGYSYEERLQQAVQDNSYALKLREIEKQAQQRVDLLAFLSSNIKDMSRTLISIYGAKKSE